MARSVSRSWRCRKGAEKEAFLKASRARSASVADRAASEARAMKKAWRKRYKGVRGRPVRQRPAPQGGGDMSDSEDSRILKPAGGDSDDDMEPGAGHDGDEQQLNDVDMDAVGRDAPDGQPGKAHGDQPMGLPSLPSWHPWVGAPLGSVSSWMVPPCMPHLASSPCVLT